MPTVISPAQKKTIVYIISFGSLYLSKGVDNIFCASTNWLILSYGLQQCRRELGLALSRGTRVEESRGQQPFLAQTGCPYLYLSPTKKNKLYCRINKLLIWQQKLSRNTSELKYKIDSAYVMKLTKHCFNLLTLHI